MTSCTGAPQGWHQPDLERFQHKVAQCRARAFPSYVPPTNWRPNRNAPYFTQVDPTHKRSDCSVCIYAASTGAIAWSACALRNSDGSFIMS